MKFEQLEVEMNLRRAAADFEQLEVMVGSVEWPQVNYYRFPCLEKMMATMTMLVGDGQHDSIHVELAPGN